MVFGQVAARPLGTGSTLEAEARLSVFQYGYVWFAEVPDGLAVCELRLDQDGEPS